jgi:hypothetical protein
LNSSFAAIGQRRREPPLLHVERTHVFAPEKNPATRTYDASTIMAGTRRIKQILENLCGFLTKLGLLGGDWFGDMGSLG